MSIYQNLGINKLIKMGVKKGKTVDGFLNKLDIYKKAVPNLNFDGQ
jgi:hypothetical protein